MTESDVDRLLAAARAAVARPDRGPIDELAEAIADYDAAAAWASDGDADRV